MSKTNTINDALGNIRDELTVPEYLEIKIRAAYDRISQHIEQPQSLLTAFNPRLSPQGSWLTRTAIKSARGGDRVDLDAVIQLQDVPANMSMLDLKDLIKRELQRNSSFSDELELPDGSRCWELRFGKDPKNPENFQFSMDILPSVSNETRQFSRSIVESFDTSKDMSELEIRYTNSKAPYSHIYNLPYMHNNWPISNPFGYAVWFDQESKKRKKISELKLEKSMRAETDPIPMSSKRLDPLRRTVQILKYHRDRAFLDERCKGKKPSSIIITTLAAIIWDGNNNLSECINQFIAEVYLKFGAGNLSTTANWPYSLINPVCSDEDFMETWKTEQERPQGFISWLDTLATDVLFKGQRLDESASLRLKKAFGSNIYEKATTGLPFVVNQRNGHTIIDVKTGHPSDKGLKAKPNRNYGNYA